MNFSSAFKKYDGHNIDFMLEIESITQFLHVITKTKLGLKLLNLQFVKDISYLIYAMQKSLLSPSKMSLPIRWQSFLISQ